MRRYTRPEAEIHESDLKQAVMDASLKVWDKLPDGSEGQLGNYGNFEEDILFGKEDKEDLWDKL